MEFGLRFDFRNPAAARTATADRYAAALEMAEWADGLGCLSIAVSEHHGSADGYLPSPIPMVAAMAARTAGVRFFIAALIAPFHDPLRLAEDMIALDNLSRGASTSSSPAATCERSSRSSTFPWTSEAGG